MLDYQDLPVLPPIRQPCRSHGTSHGYLAAFWATPRHRQETMVPKEVIYTPDAPLFPAYSQAMKLPVNDRNELAGGFLIAICQLFQQRGYVGGTGSTLCLPKPFELSPRAVDDILLQFCW